MYPLSKKWRSHFFKKKPLGVRVRVTRTPSRGQRKNIRILHGTGSMPCCATVDLGNLLCRQPESAVLLGGKAKPVLLHRCQNAEISLYSTGIVVE